MIMYIFNLVRTTRVLMNLFMCYHCQTTEKSDNLKSYGSSYPKDLYRIKSNKVTYVWGRLTLVLVNYIIYLGTVIKT